MWGKTLAFVILFILIFGILIVWIPDYFGLGTEVQDSEALDAIDASSLLIYTSSGSDNMTKGYSSYEDGPDPPNWNVSLPEGEYLEVWWGPNVFGDYDIELRHLGTAWYGGPSRIDSCRFYYTNGERAYGSSWGGGLQKTELQIAWSDETNSSAFTAKCEHISVSIVFKPDNGTADIGEAYDAGTLWYALSYELNADETGMNVMGLIWKLLTFQGLGVGVPGQLGAFIDAVVSALFYCAIAVVAYIVITAVIPFVGGAPDS